MSICGSQCEHVIIERTVCLDTDSLVHVWCPDNRTERRKYLKGHPSVPLTWCKFHTKPDDPQDPIDPLPRKFDEYHIHWIGLLSWMYLNPDKEIDFLMEKSRRAGASCIHSFTWVGDPTPGNNYHMYATPWEWRDGKVDFSQWNPDFEFQFKRLATACKKWDMDFMPILFMSRYNDHVFERLNHQGIDDFYSIGGMFHQKQYAYWCIEWLKEVYGDDYQPTILPINEAAHYGSDEEGHKIADWHRDIGDYILDYTIPERLWIDTSHSEYAHSSYVEAHKCPKCDRILGRDEYLHRPIRPESHGCSTKEGFIDNGYDHWATSGWKHGAFSEDGSEFGSKLCDEIPAFRQAGTAELREALEWAKSLQGDKQAYFVAFPFDPIKNAMEDYSNPLKFDWERLNVYKEVYGDD